MERELVVGGVEDVGASARGREGVRVGVEGLFDTVRVSHDTFATMAHQLEAIRQRMEPLLLIVQQWESQQRPFYYPPTTTTHFIEEDEADNQVKLNFMLRLFIYFYLFLFIFIYSYLLDRGEAIGATFMWLY